MSAVEVCRKCGLPVEMTDSRTIVVTGTGTTADGLSYCPPDPREKRNPEEKIMLNHEQTLDAMNKLAKKGRPVSVPARTTFTTPAQPDPMRRTPGAFGRIPYQELTEEQRESRERAFRRRMWERLSRIREDG